MHVTRRIVLARLWLDCVLESMTSRTFLRILGKVARGGGVTPVVSLNLTDDRQQQQRAGFQGTSPLLFL